MGRLPLREDMRADILLYSGNDTQAGILTPSGVCACRTVDLDMTPSKKATARVSLQGFL